MPFEKPSFENFKKDIPTINDGLAVYSTIENLSGDLGEEVPQEARELRERLEQAHERGSKIDIDQVTQELRDLAKGLEARLKK